MPKPWITPKDAIKIVRDFGHYEVDPNSPSYYSEPFTQPPKYDWVHWTLVIVFSFLSGLLASSIGFYYMFAILYK
jgi:hypothetical protein